MLNALSCVLCSMSKVDLSDAAAIAAMDVDLSEATFTRLMEKQEAMEQLKVGLRSHNSSRNKHWAV
jgi:hypothetical protein